jgi:hypothetical protein
LLPKQALEVQRVNARPPSAREARFHTSPAAHPRWASVVSMPFVYALFDFWTRILRYQGYLLQVTWKDQTYG